MIKNIAVIFNQLITVESDNASESQAVARIEDSITALCQALDQLNCKYFTIPLEPPISNAEEVLQGLDADLVLNQFEGFDSSPGSEASIARTLTDMGLRFTGSPSDVLFICENKSVIKTVLRLNGIPTPDWQILSHDNRFNKKAGFSLRFPCMVKPLGEHGSYGISDNSLVNDAASLKQQVKSIWEEFEQRSVVEEYLPGREFRVLITGNTLLKVYPVQEIVYNLPEGKPKILTYRSKWLYDHEDYTHSQEVCPADIDIDLQHEIEKLAIRSFAALKCRGYATIDMRQDKNGQLMVIDVNPNSDLSATGCVKHPLEATGISYAGFINEIIDLAMEEPEEHTGEYARVPVKKSSDTGV